MWVNLMMKVLNSLYEIVDSNLMMINIHTKENNIKSYSLRSIIIIV